MKGFSLIEILIFMGVAALLLLLSITGLQILSRNSRDSERVSIAGEMNNLINKFRREKLKYPSNLEVSIQTSLFSITGMTDSISLNGHLKSESTTTNGGTKYIYTYVSSSEYQLCVALESGTYKGFGTAACPN